MWLEVLFAFIVGYLIYFFCFKPYNYWKNRGIVYEVPLPLVGNFKDAVLRKTSISDVYDFLYKKYSDKRYVGIYIFRKPALLIRDICLVNKICVEGFENFSDRVQLVDKDLDTLVGKILVNLRGKSWKEMRSTLSPAFAPIEMSKNYDLIAKCANNFTNNFVEDNRNFIEIQLKDIFSRFESDVISSVCFGMENNSLVNTENEFFQMYKEIKRFGALEKLKLSFTQLCPGLSKLLRIKVFPTSTTDVFKKILKEAIEKREADGIVRNDFIHYLIGVRNGALKKNTDLEEELHALGEAGIDKLKVTQYKQWTVDEIAIQALIFLISHVGVEAILALSSCMAYELVLNPHIQVKVQDEIDDVLQVSGSATVSYESVAKMKFLDCVVAETLRKWPPVYQLDRECVKQFIELDASLPDDEKLVIAEGTTIVVPVMAIHRDPHYFPLPEKFNPERFNEENLEDILPGSYIPFGRGPRDCIGSKFALLEIKLLFFFLLSKFDLVPTGKTDFRQNEMHVNSVIDTYVGLKPRKVTSL